MGLTFVVAGGEHSLVCRTGANVPYLPSLVQKDSLINDVILIIKVNDVDLKEPGEEGMPRMKRKNPTRHTQGLKCESRFCIIQQRSMELELLDMNGSV